MKEYYELWKQNNDTKMWKEVKGFRQVQVFIGDKQPAGVNGRLDFSGSD